MPSGKKKIITRSPLTNLVELPNKNVFSETMFIKNIRSLFIPNLNSRDKNFFLPTIKEVHKSVLTTFVYRRLLFIHTENWQEC